MDNNLQKEEKLYGIICRGVSVMCMSSSEEKREIGENKFWKIFKLNDFESWKSKILRFTFFSLMEQVQESSKKKRKRAVDFLCILFECNQEEVSQLLYELFSIVCKQWALDPKKSLQEEEMKQILSVLQAIRDFSRRNELYNGAVLNALAKNSIFGSTEGKQKNDEKKLYSPFLTPMYSRETL